LEVFAFDEGVCCVEAGVAEGVFVAPAEAYRHQVFSITDVKFIGFKNICIKLTVYVPLGFVLNLDGVLFEESRVFRVLFEDVVQVDIALPNKLVQS